MKKRTQTLILSAILIGQAQSKTPTEKNILGVYKLTKFATVSPDGTETPWCTDASGTIAYVPGYMHVGINCKGVEANTQAEEFGGKLFYSGPFEIDSKKGEVVHRVRNYSHPSLNKVLRRQVTLENDKQLSLMGDSVSGGKIVIEWERIEKFKYNDSSLTGFYELVGSENEVEGSDQKIPFCSGFHGSILYTPGGFGAVAINCGEKTNPLAVEPADMFGRRYFYSGRYRQEENILTQSIQYSSEEKQIGTEARRLMIQKDDLLMLDGVNGSKFRATWRKLRSFVNL